MKTKRPFWTVRKRFLVFLLFSLGVIAGRNAIFGFAAEAIFQSKLSYWFGMPVEIQGLTLDPFAGEAFARRITFWNQPQFSKHPHMDMENVRIFFDPLGIRNKNIHIFSIEADNPFFLIERFSLNGETQNNVVQWFNRLKKIIHGNRKNDDDDEKDQGKDERLKVLIDRIQVNEGTFVIHDFVQVENEKKFIFRKINGYLTGLHRPNDRPTLLLERFRLDGVFGEKTDAPTFVEGKSSFATSQISFEGHGQIKGGSVVEQKSFWHGLPLTVKGGSFDLDLQAKCILRDLKMKNDIKMNNLKIGLGPSAADKIWGVPATAFLQFLKEEKALHLKVPVSGEISDPQFDVISALSKAFQKSLERKMKTSAQFLLSETAKFAEQTTDVVLQVPKKLVETLGKVTEEVLPLETKSTQAQASMKGFSMPLLPFNRQEENK